MTSETIAQMAVYMPRKEGVDMASCTEGLESIGGLADSQASDVLHYASCFKNLRIGWDFASELARNSEVKFPSIFHGDDLYVWRAYCFLKGEDDPDVSGAVALESGKCPGKDAIRAMLVNSDGEHSVVSRFTNIRPSVIKAYEKLFFNVRDRLKDHTYMASVIYPDSRMVEAFEDYVDENKIDVLMLRAGYSRGMGHVLYASGLSRKHPYESFNAADGANELDKMFMQDGIFIGSMGFMHQRHHNGAISNARLSMQASKMGNGDGNGSSVFDNIGMIALGELDTLTKKKAYALSEGA